MKWWQLRTMANRHCGFWTSTLLQLVITDISMAHMDGIELCQKIRERSKEVRVSAAHGLWGNLNMPDRQYSLV